MLLAGAFAPWSFDLLATCSNCDLYNMLHAFLMSTNVYMLVMCYCSDFTPVYCFIFKLVFHSVELSNISQLQYFTATREIFSVYSFTAILMVNMFAVCCYCTLFVFGMWVNINYSIFYVKMQLGYYYS